MHVDQRAIILLPIHNRLLRLHRASDLLLFSVRSPQLLHRALLHARLDRYPIRAVFHCLPSARFRDRQRTREHARVEFALLLVGVCVASSLLRSIRAYEAADSHGLGAITVLSMSLLRKQHLGLDTASARERTVILAVRRFFERSTSYHMASATVHPTSKQALLIIDRILAATEPSTNVNPHSPLSGPRTPVAAMLRSIAASVAGGGPTKVGEVEASHDDFGVTARALLSDSMLFGGGDPTLSSTNDNAFQFGGFSWSAAASPNANAALMEATTIPATGFDALASQRALYGFATDLSPGMEPGGLPDWSALLGMDTAI